MNSVIWLVFLAAVGASGLSIQLRQNPETLCINQQDFLRIASIDDCVHYYQCYSGRAYLLQCPDDTWFNEEIQVCDPNEAPARCVVEEPEIVTEPETETEVEEEPEIEGAEPEEESEIDGAEPEEETAVESESENEEGSETESELDPNPTDGEVDEDSDLGDETEPEIPHGEESGEGSGDDGEIEPRRFGKFGYGLLYVHGSHHNNDHKNEKVEAMVKLIRTLQQEELQLVDESKSVELKLRKLLSIQKELPEEDLAENEDVSLNAEDDIEIDENNRKFPKKLFMFVKQEEQEGQTIDDDEIEEELRSRKLLSSSLQEELPEEDLGEDYVDVTTLSAQSEEIQKGQEDIDNSTVDEDDDVKIDEQNIKKFFKKLFRFAA